LVQEFEEEMDKGITCGGSMILIAIDFSEICSKETRGLQLKSMRECKKILPSNLSSLLIKILQVGG
jgi:hypothetical protein